LDVDAVERDGFLVAVRRAVSNLGLVKADHNDLPT
jgi:hypothetical protein